MKGINKKNSLRHSLAAGLIVLAVNSTDVAWQMYLTRKWEKFPLRGGRF